MLLWKRWGLGVLALCVMACGAALVPVWVTELEGYQSSNYLYVGDDEATSYLVSVYRLKGLVQLTELNGDGQVVAEWEVSASELEFLPDANLIPLGGDRAMLVGRRPEQVLLLDPHGGQIEWGLKGLQLAEDEYLSIWSSHLTSTGTLVFSGTVFKGVNEIEERIPAFGIVDQKLNVLQLQTHPEFDNSSLFYDADNQRLVAVGSYEDENIPSIVQILDENLTIQSEQTLPYFLRPVEYMHGFVMGNALIEGEGVNLAVSLDGSISYPTPNDYSVRDRYSVPSGYYEVGTVYDLGVSVRVCFYDREFVQQWCRQTASPNGSLYLVSASLTDNGEIAFTTWVKAERIMGIGLSVEELTDALRAGFEVRGEVRKSVSHYVYNQKGKLVTSFTEPEFFYQGRMTICSIFDFCIAADDITPGVCAASNAVYRNGNQMVSVTGYCTEEYPVDRRISLWQW